MTNDDEAAYQGAIVALRRDRARWQSLEAKASADAARWIRAYRGEDPGEGAAPEQVELYWSRRPLPEGWALRMAQPDGMPPMWATTLARHGKSPRLHPTRAAACRYAWAQESELSTPMAGACARQRGSTPEAELGALIRGVKSRPAEETDR